MFRFWPYILKTIWGHRARSLLTVSGAGVALFVYCFVIAVQEGLDRLTALGEADRDLIVFQANRFCPATSRLPEDYARWIEQQSGVEQVLPIKVFTNNCRASLDVIVFHGIPPKLLRSARQFSLAEGTWADFESRPDGALVGQSVARRRGIRVGKPFTVGDVTVQVVGIYRANNSSEDNFIYTHLDYLQRTANPESVGFVTQFEVRLAEDVNLTAAAAAIDDRYRAGPVETDTRAKGVFQAHTVADVAELIGLSRYLGLACLGVVLALVSTTTVMAVQDRICEHAVLQTIGLSPARVFGIVLTESTLVSLCGGLLGVVLALLVLGSGGLVLGTEGVTIAFVPSWRQAFSGIAVSLLTGILAGMFPAWQAARMEIVAALRHA